MATSIKIDSSLKDRVQQLAELRDRSAHWLMLDAIRQYVEREEARESFKQEALNSWKAYQQTGLHLSGDEVEQWLADWDEEDAAEPPACHE